MDIDLLQRNCFEKTCHPTTRSKGNWASLDIELIKLVGVSRFTPIAFLMLMRRARITQDCFGECCRKTKKRCSTYFTLFEQLKDIKLYVGVNVEGLFKDVNRKQQFWNFSQNTLKPLTFLNRHLLLNTHNVLFTAFIM